jgi:hypothetical protein
MGLEGIVYDLGGTIWGGGHFASMVQLIDQMFGPTLEDKNATHIVSSAWVIKYGLTRPHYKAADEL